MLQGLFELFFGRRTIGSLQQDSCYKIAVAHIKVEQGKKYLSVPEKGSIQHINDIDDVAEMESDEELAAAAVVEGVVNAVLSCEECLSCVNCSSKITATSEVVNCGKCFAKRKVTNCNMNSVAQVILQSETDGRTHRVTIFDEVLTAILKDVPGAIVSKRLLCTPLCQFNIK